NDPKAVIAGIEEAVWLANAVLPVGWLPLGVRALAGGRAWPAALGLLGMSAIGAASLGRAYRTAVGQYQGRGTGRSGRADRPADVPRPRREGRGLLVEARLPGLSEPVAAVALASFRSLLRAPEAKMALLTPLIMTAAFGSAMVGGRQEVPE